MTFQNSANNFSNNLSEINKLKFPRRGAADKATVVRKTKQSRNLIQRAQIICGFTI